MSHRSPAAVTGVAVALLAAVAGVSPASAATPAPKAKLATSNQKALLDARTAVVTVAAPAHSAASVRLYADGHPVSTTRKVTFNRARTVRVKLALTSAGKKRLRDCSADKLEVRMAIRRGTHTTMVRDRQMLALDARHCPAPAALKTTDAPSAQKPADTPSAPKPAGDTPPAQEQKKPSGDAPQNDKSLFRVGTSVVDITPNKAMPIGGYGSNYIVSGARDPLQVRAFFVGKGKDAVTLVSVDAQGWFASYQTPNVGDGAADARRDAAAILADRGYDVDADNVVVSVTHDHAAPTIQGIWGHTDPEYLHKVKQATVQAVAEAQSNARDAELWSANGTIRGLVSEVQGTDQMAGFNVDAELPILWAREPATGKTLATYADVPVHVDQYNPINASDHKFSADYPGYVRDRLADTLGGTSVIAAGTLGRQEAIGASSEYVEVAEQGRFITNAMMRALAHAHRITDTTLGAASQSFSTPAENGGLLAGMSCNHTGGPIGCPGPLTEPAANNGTGTWNWSPVGGIFTINRALTAPWYTPGAGNGSIGTSSTVARIGDQVYATAPGEAFPEVTSAIQRSFAASDGIRAAHIIDHAGDQLGYYWDQRPGVYPAAQLAQSDFTKFNVSSHLAQDNVDAVRAAGAALGLAPSAQNAFAEVNNANAFSEPHVQFYPNRVETADTTVSMYSSAKKAQSNSLGSTSFGSTASTQDSLVSWDFGDGTTATQAPSTRFTHTFPAPGTYRVEASIVDNLGKTYSWVQTVEINAPLSAVVHGDTKNGHVLNVRADGGHRDLLAAHWKFSDGTTAEGDQVTDAPDGPATVTIVDGAGNTATTTVDVG